ncbi:hypothetical protein [Nonomuraea antimicrobica]|uniref:hypothetical protein n=1 Tax=Nonomuraea antimicrobica TaxID=561173 RepID=UPI0031EE7F6E
MLLALQFSHIGGGWTGAAVGVINGFGALFVFVVNVQAGRGGARLGRRGTWILAGASAVALAVLALMFTTRMWLIAVIWWAT